jgi:hypothetical protein
MTCLFGKFIEEFNGKCFFLDENWITNDTVQLYTDASGAYGYGAVCGQSWFSGEWNAEWISENMTFTDIKRTLSNNSCY